MRGKQEILRKRERWKAKGTCDMNVGMRLLGMGGDSRDGEDGERVNIIKQVVFKNAHTKIHIFAS